MPLSRCLSICLSARESPPTRRAHKEDLRPVRVQDIRRQVLQPRPAAPKASGHSISTFPDIPVTTVSRDVVDLTQDDQSCRISESNASSPASSDQGMGSTPSRTSRGGSLRRLLKQSEKTPRGEVSCDEEWQEEAVEPPPIVDPSVRSDEEQLESEVSGALSPEQDATAEWTQNNEVFPCTPLGPHNATSISHLGQCLH